MEESVGFSVTSFALRSFILLLFFIITDCIFRYNRAYRWPCVKHVFGLLNFIWDSLIDKSLSIIGWIFHQSMSVFEASLAIKNPSDIELENQQ